MDRSLTWTIETKDGSERVVLSGELTENSNVIPLAETLSGRVLFDLAGVARINSPGVREWINFVSRLGQRGVAFVFERCSPPFVNQLNMISNFRGTGEVRSILAPYFCPKCAVERQRLLEIDGNALAYLNEPYACPTCGTIMEFDDIPEAYLAFHDSE